LLPDFSYPARRLAREIPHFKESKTMLTPKTAAPTIRIRDPIHGTLHLSRAEIGLIDAPAYQRLRMIKQLGLADLAFPGATHTRYAHGLGTMHNATRMFDQISQYFDLNQADKQRLGATVRLAALFHDLGHAPLSHTTEAFMPPVKALELGRWQEGADDSRASHEDYTLKFLVDSELTKRIEKRITPESGVTPDDIAALVAGRTAAPEDRKRFFVQGHDWLPVLRQCVSSELDADRMDYLLRDSYYAGVPYGRYDLEWLLENLIPVIQDERVHLGLDARASFSFEDFLLSRYHMFTSVYLHQIPISYEVMLRKYQAEETDTLIVPSDIETYLRCDDVWLWNALRQSNNQWAARIVDRRAYRMLAEVKEFQDQGDDDRRGAELNLEEMRTALDHAGIDAIVHGAKGKLSKYYKISSRPKPADDLDPNMYIVDGQQTIPIESYSPVFRRYAGAVNINRIYVDPEKFRDAKELLGR
jgi:uncharacterized protein